MGVGYNEQFVERCAILGTVDPGALSATTYNTDIVDMRYWRRVAFILLAGTIGDVDGTLQLQLYVNTANSTSSPAPTAVAGKVFTATNFSGSTDSNKQGIIEITAEECETALDFGRYLFATLTVGTQTSGASVLVLGIDARYGPATEYDLASVTEVIS